MSEATARVIVLTGATGGLGQAAAQAFANQGHSLVLLGTDQTRLDELTSDLGLPAERVLTYTLDLRDGPAVQKMVEAVVAKFKRIDALFHLVGGWVGGKTLADASTDDLEFMLGQHVWTTFYLFQAISPKLAANGWGRVMVVSASTTTKPPGKGGPYTAAKAAQENLVLTLAAELKDHGVTANIIQVKAIDEDQQGKGTEPEEIVAAMTYLFSEEAARVSGVRIPLYT